MMGNGTQAVPYEEKEESPRRFASGFVRMGMRYNAGSHVFCSSEDKQDLRQFGSGHCPPLCVWGCGTMPDHMCFTRLTTSRICDSLGPGTARLLQLKGTGVELVVGALLGDELLVGATLDDAAVVEDHDAVGVHNRG